MGNENKFFFILLGGGDTIPKRRILKLNIIVELLHCFEEQEHLKGVSHISYFCGKILGKSNLRKEVFNSVRGLGYHAIIPAEAEAAGHVASAARKGREKRAGAQTVFSFFSPSPWNGSVRAEGRASHLGTLSQACHQVVYVPGSSVLHPLITHINHHALYESPHSSLEFFYSHTIIISILYFIVKRQLRGQKSCVAVHILKLYSC